MLCKEAVIRKEAKETGNIKRHRDGKDAEVEKALYEWWEFATVRNIPLNGRILCAKAQSFAERAGHQDFRATDGWFSRWKVRNGVVFTKLAGEAAEADLPAVANFIKDVLPNILKTYHPKDILNADETGIYFRALPSSTYVKKRRKMTAKDSKRPKTASLR